VAVWAAGAGRCFPRSRGYLQPLDEPGGFDDGMAGLIKELLERRLAEGVLAQDTFVSEGVGGQIAAGDDRALALAHGFVRPADGGGGGRGGRGDGETGSVNSPHLLVSLSPRPPITIGSLGAEGQLEVGEIQAGGLAVLQLALEKAFEVAQDRAFGETDAIGAR